MANPSSKISEWCCAGKQAHDSPEKARKAARSMSSHGKTVDFYRCPHCRLWHLGRHHGAKKRMRPAKGRR